jgi:L-gulonolactone oxidase
VRVRASSVADVQAAIATAAERGLPLRVAGSGHSFSPLCVTDGVLVTLDGLTGLREVDHERGLVTVHAGTVLHDLGQLLLAEGLAQENLGDIDVQTVAGATATATHGTGIGYRPVSAQIAAVELVDGSGTLRRLDSGDELAAAQCSVGALGVVTAVTLQCVPAFNLRSTEELMPLDRVYAEAVDLARSTDHWELFTFPHARRAVTHTMTRTADPIAVAHPVVEHLRRHALGNGVFGAVQRLGRARPALIPWLNRAVTLLAEEPERTDASHRVFANPRLVRFTEMELAVPAEHAGEALRRAVAVAERQDPAVSFPIQLRFAAPDTSLIGPAHGRETAYIAVHVFQGMPWEAYFRAVADALRELDARPHWGKRHFEDAASLSRLHPGWDRFQAVRAALDPEGRFAGPVLERLLGPVGARA